jgi:hypothetical protein
MMTPGSSDSSRLVFKRVFADYYLALSTPAIADPTEAFAASRAYLGQLRKQLGSEEFMNRLDDEATGLLGQVEQDLRQRLRGRAAQLSFDDLEDRLRECLEHGLGRLDVTRARFSVE